ncbi:hypothetical protein HMPREF0379_1867 [[Eubacterium] yurii subsp. margaretiae ATCC 43715]|nr:hypothetical protein HMPREF0379_1867 [[Eubacterium] yurii subsp. margaretiae ATCC 43715]
MDEKIKVKKSYNFLSINTNIVTNKNYIIYFKIYDLNDCNQAVNS